MLLAANGSNMPKTEAQIFEAVKQYMIDNNLERVRNPTQFYEYEDGRPCRVCLFGATLLAVTDGKIDDEERERVAVLIRKAMDARHDTVETLNTIKNRDDMFKLFDEAVALC